MDLRKNVPSEKRVTVDSTITDAEWLNKQIQFAVSQRSGSVQLFDAVSGKKERSLVQGHSEIGSLTIDADDRYFAVAGPNTIDIFSLDDEQDASPQHVARPDGKFHYLFPLGSAFASATDKSVSIYDYDNGDLTGRIPIEVDGTTQRVVRSPNGKWVVTYGNDNYVSLWDGSTGDFLATIRGHNNVVYGVTLDSDGRVVTGSRDKTIRLSSPQDVDPSLTLRGHEGRIWSVDFSPSGNVLASASSDSNVILWDAKTGRQLYQLTDHTESVQFVTFSPTDPILATASRDDTIKLWNTETRELIGDCLGHTGDINSLAYSSDGRRIVSGGDDGAVIVWNQETRKPVARYDAEGVRVWAVAMAKDGSVLFGGTDGKMSKWNYLDEKAPEELYAPEHNITSLRCSPDGATVAVTTSDGALTLIDYENKTVGFQTTGHTSDAMFTAFSNDDRTLVSAGSDGVIQFWYLKVNEPTLQIKAHDQHIHAVALTADGSKVATGSWDQTIKIWKSR